MADNDRTGQQLGNYRLTRLLGEGGFAEVYLGEHVYLKTDAAIKVLHTRLAKDELEDFLNEARTIARLKHNHIVRVLDFGVEGRIPFLVMEYAPNGSLRQRHPKGVLLPLVTVVSYVKQVTDALQYAHDKKLIHRDIKPENMLLGEHNEVLLSDFGIALIAQSTHSQSTQEAIGTVGYMAPEQLQGKPRRASDQYSLGIVVYEWLSGSRPFQGSFVEIYSQHLSVPPPPLREKNPAISPAVEQVVLNALAKDPYQRFVSVHEFATALEQASQPEPILLSVSPPTTPSMLPSIPTDEIVDGEEDPVERDDPALLPWTDPIPGGDKDRQEPSHVYDVHPRNSRKENIQPLSPWEDFDREHTPQPIQNQPKRNLPPTPVYPMGTRPLTVRNQARQPRSSAPSRPVPAKLDATNIRQRPHINLPGRASGPIRKSTLQWKSVSGKKIALISSVIFFLLIGTLVYFGPSTDVTITLPSQSFSTPVTLTATAHSQQDVRLHTVPAQNLSFDTSAQGTGRATGSTKIGTVQATGAVDFTNNGPQQVDIPGGTVVSTDSGVQFATTADAVVLTKTSNIGNTMQVPVQAVLPGDSGNVPANSIILLPPESTTKIEQASQLASVSVTVTNPTATTGGGGAGNATTVKSLDINTEKAVLDKQLQAAVSVWLAQQVHSGDVQGKLVQVETPLATPAQGQIAQNGTFTETLNLHLTVLVVRAADLQTASSAQLNDAAKTQHSGFALVPQQHVQLGSITSTPSSDGTALTLSFIAMGQIAPAISEQDVRGWLSGKTVDDARTYLKGNPNIMGSDITVYPSFFPWIPFWSQRINVYFYVPVKS